MAKRSHNFAPQLVITSYGLDWFPSIFWMVRRSAKVQKSPPQRSSFALVLRRSPRLGLGQCLNELLGLNAAGAVEMA